jgi:hypothetical protein
MFRIFTHGISGIQNEVFPPAATIDEAYARCLKAKNDGYGVKCLAPNGRVLWVAIWQDDFAPDMSPGLTPAQVGLA